MVARVRITPKEKEQLSRIMKEGWNRDLEWWTIARIALTRSLQIAEAPDPETYAPVSTRPGGAELHSPQLTGEGKGEEEDFTDLYRGLLSIYEGRDLFEDEDVFHDCLQRHVRRGIAVISADLSSGADINRYIVDELFAERTGSAESVESDSVALGERVTRVLGQIGVGAKLLSSFEGPRLTRFTFELGLLDDLDRLRRGTSKIAFALGLGDAAVSVSLGSSARTVVLDIPRPSSAWRTVAWSELAAGLSSPAAMEMNLPICVGTDVMGQPFLLDLSEAPHLFVGGTTGSGKSMCLHTIMLSLLRQEQRPDLLLIDPKAVEFAGYRDLPNLIGGGTVVTPDESLHALEGLVETMDARRDVLGKFKARDIAEANANGAGLRRIVAVIDELGDLLMTRPEVEVPLVRLAQKARSVGIHLVLATQRPEAATFPGLLRSNIPSRIALTVQKASESRIILDDGGAEDLLGKGDMLVKFAGQQMVRVHGGRVTPADIIAAVR